MGRGGKGNGEKRLGKTWEEVRDEPMKGVLQPSRTVVAKKKPKVKGFWIERGN